MEHALAEWHGGEQAGGPFGRGSGTHERSACNAGQRAPLFTTTLDRRTSAQLRVQKASVAVCRALDPRFDHIGRFDRSSRSGATPTELYSWGNNQDGQLGIGNTTNSTTPVKVQLPSGVSATAVAAGAGHSLAAGSDGKLYAWGLNANGELGNGTTTPSSTPIVVSMPAGVTATAVSAGAGHSVALGSDGNVYDWATTLTASWVTARRTIRPCLSR